MRANGLVQSGVMAELAPCQARLSRAAGPGVCENLAMAEDPDKDAPSLEPPPLFGRKKKTPKAPKAARPTRHAEPAEPAAAAPTEPDTLVSPRVHTRVDAPADPSV